MNNCALAVHLLPETVPERVGWKLNVAAAQIEHCLLKSTGNEEFSVQLWRDPRKGLMFDEQCLAEIDEKLAATGDQYVKTTIFEEFTPSVKAALKRPAKPKRVSDRVYPDRVYYDVVIDHWDVDSNDAAAILKYIEKSEKSPGMRAQLANAASRGVRSSRTLEQNEEMFYPRARRFVVLFGKTHDRYWPNQVCFALQKHIESRDQGPGLVIVAPPPNEPEGKPNFRAPLPDLFWTESCLDRRHGPLLDRWLSHQGLEQ